MKTNPCQFDACAEDYDSELNRGLSVSGETKEFFAQGRIRWLSSLLAALAVKPVHVLDYGCGTGANTHLLTVMLECKCATGVDISLESLKIARSTWRGSSLSFLSINEHQPQAECDVAFCNGVFHHIPVVDRPAALAYIHRSLRAGGLFSLWENNPWNPGTRFVMSRIPFDRDAVPLRARTARHLVKNAGFTVLRTDFMFVFPRVLSWFRRLEPRLCKLPIGAQYQVLCMKP